MVNKCCVPGCRSNYKIKKGEHSVTCFMFPIEEQLKEKWSRKIPHHNLKVSKHTVVCIKYFSESDIIKNDVLPGKHEKPDTLISKKNFLFKRMQYHASSQIYCPIFLPPLALFIVVPPLAL